jgi:hypothetical protein
MQILFFITYPKRSAVSLKTQNYTFYVGNLVSLHLQSENHSEHACDLFQI